jgi:hypothetical protein
MTSYFGTSSWNTSQSKVSSISISLLQGSVVSSGTICNYFFTNLLIYVSDFLSNLSGTGSAVIFVLQAFKFILVNPITAQSSPLVRVVFFFEFECVLLDWNLQISLTVFIPSLNLNVTGVMTTSPYPQVSCLDFSSPNNEIL